ncbi:MAG: C_GCAxxG_C_C family protein [Anaerolineae bacterium]|nr:C_GCAxxG_C_C family protein [Anaerolineae bacterium]
MLAVGEHLWGSVDERTRRMTSAFSGGLGGTHAELCGALSGGAMIIGALNGRANLIESNAACKALAARYREAFLARFGMTICSDLRSHGYGGGGIPCAVLVEQAVEVLLDVLAEAGY